MGTFTELFQQLDTDARKRGAQFERICKWFLTNDPLYKERLRKVWLWKEWPDRWSGTEAGIDLVAEDFDGKLWAIQAKAYAEDRDIPKSELDKFLSESNRAIFSDRLLIATTDGLHHIARGTLTAQEKNVYFVGLSGLREADDYLDWPASPNELHASPTLRPSKPRDYQRQAISDVVAGFRNADRGQLIMACGTGKTLTSLFIKEELAADRTLVLVPSLSLLKQTMRAWYSNRSGDFASLPVCSDITVSNNNDALVASTADLGVPVTTDAAQIAAFLRRRDSIVVFSTYQSSPQIAEAFAVDDVPAFDLVIADEAHRCAGRVSSDFAAILDESKILAAKRLFMTATPRFFTGRVVNAANAADFEYASMDDESKFGPVFHRLGFSDSIKRGLLTDYRVVVIGVDNATYKDWAERGAFVTLDGETVHNARALAGQIGLAKAMRKYNLRRTISFHSRVRSAQQFAESMHQVLSVMPADRQSNAKLWTAHVSGAMSAGERHRLLQHLKDLGDGECGLLSNARCLAEGVDVPTLDGVAFIDPRSSEVDIMQAVGRAIRKADDKTAGTIVIPVFIDSDEDPETALNDGTVFKPVWDVVRALRAHDDELGMRLDQLRVELGRLGALGRLPDRIHLDLPQKVGADFVEAFDVRLVEQTTTTWEFWFGLLHRFVEDHGHASVGQGQRVDGYLLGNWVSTQRGIFSRGLLEPDRQVRLEQLPGWSWDRFSDKWEEGYQRLSSYAELHGTTRITRFYIEEDGYRLGFWVSTQRSNFSRGLLVADRQVRLEQLPGWSWDRFSDKWEEGYQRLTDYVLLHGDACVPRHHRVEGYRLGFWVSTQRDNYKNGLLDPDRQRRLEELPGWAWELLAGQWEENFRRLATYAERHGDTRVPRTYTVDGLKLGHWVSTQLSSYRNGTLDPDRQRRLEELPGWAWERSAGQWEENFRRLVSYVERYGDTRVPRNFSVDGFQLGVWVARQRSNYNKGKLDPNQERLLNQLPGWTWRLPRGPRTGNLRPIGEVPER